MKTTFKLTAISIFGASILYSCYSERPISAAPPANNETYTVEYLFEHDGCKVYRFWDYGHYVYFTNCVGETNSFKNDSTETPLINIIRKAKPAK